MSLTVNAKTFTADSFQQNAIVYNGPAHTLSVKDDIRMGRVSPKPSADFSGVGRTAVKLTRTLTLTGAQTPTGEAICEISMSIPVGAASGDVDAICNDMGAYLSSATAKLVAKNLAINY